MTVFFKTKIMIFFIKIKDNSEITSLLIHGGQWTATLKTFYF